jgi:effector-binding domain-containing protein
LWGELENRLAGQQVRPVGAAVSLYHDDEYSERDWEIEVCQPVSADLVSGKRLRVRDLPQLETMACSIHHGPLTAISEAYNAIGKWIEVNGYLTCGLCREMYLIEAKPVGPSEAGNIDQNDPETVVEIQFPVEKV